MVTTALAFAGSISGCRGKYFLPGVARSVSDTAPLFSSASGTPSAEIFLIQT
jgi:hypothetical protein